MGVTVSRLKERVSFISFDITNHQVPNHVAKKSMISIIDKDMINKGSQEETRVSVHCRQSSTFMAVNMLVGNKMKIEKINSRKQKSKKLKWFYRLLRFFGWHPTWQNVQLGYADKYGNANIQMLWKPKKKIEFDLNPNAIIKVQCPKLGKTTTVWLYLHADNSQTK